MRNKELKKRIRNRKINNWFRKHEAILFMIVILSLFLVEAVFAWHIYF